jgi:DNA-directed RNA polymerase specialized sigma24 family protein
MSSAGSVTHWLTLLRAGDHAAAQPLWQRYFQQLVRLARRRLRGTRGRMADEEDVALSAFDTFCRRAKDGRFPRLDDREDLWQVLVLLTGRKAIRLGKYEHRQKRGGGLALREADLPGDADDGPALARVVGREPTPAFAAEVAEECRRRLDRLTEDGLRAVALWKMEGYTTEEIAAKLACAPRTVERKLRRIRLLWESEDAP